MEVGSAAIPKDLDHLEETAPIRAFKLRKVCEHYEGGTILDIGCGGGQIARLLGQTGIPVLGIDPDENEIRRARSGHQLENVEFACLDAAAMPSDAYTGVILSEVLEHLDDPAALLEQAWRVCRDDGFLIVSVPNGYCLKETLTAFFRALRTRYPPVGKVIEWHRIATKKHLVFNASPHVQRFRIEEIRRLIQDARFVIEEEIHAGIWSSFLFSFLNFLPVPQAVRRMETRAAQHLPGTFLEQWAFFCRKTRLEDRPVPVVQ